MLVCPQCQFENPNTNKFCEKCGTSLVCKICQECGVQVAFTEEKCPQCSAVVGTFWRATIFKDVTWQAENNPVAEPSAETSSAAVADHEIVTVNLSQAKSEQQPTAPEEVYLDLHQRYRLLSPLLPLSEQTEEVQVLVLDCQPLQQSPLAALVHGFNLEVGSTTASATEIWQNVGIPAIAQPYLALQESFDPILPKIHDAWQQDGQVVLLLEDRSQFESLKELWQNEDLPAFQIVYGLGQMLQLWSELETWHCRQSLLEIDNLRVDEDQTLSLQQLYPEPKDSQLGLKDLAQVWQDLLPPSRLEQLASLTAILTDLSQGEITTLEQLRSRFQALAGELQASESSSPSTPAEEATETSPALVNSSQNDFPEGEELDLDDRDRGDDLPTVVLPMQLVGLDDAGGTDIGRDRNRNEDYFGIQTQVSRQENPLGRSVQARGLYILCDGMGGHAGGEVASAMAVETLKRYFQENWGEEMPPAEVIRDGILLANQAIYDINQQNARSGNARMGTTLVMVLVQNTQVAIAHVGDSRLYRLTRKRPLEQVTVDHEVGQREIQRGVEPAIAYSRPDAYQLTQALGPRDENFVRPDIQFLELNEDTLFLLCSDGMSDRDVLENNWQSHLLPLMSSRANLEQGLRELIDFANQQNGHDNITALLIRTKVRPNLEQQNMH